MKKGNAGSHYAPRHLGPAGRAFWTTVVSGFALEEHQLTLLAAACESLDRAAGARALVEAEGAVVRDRWNQAKPHPAVAIERDARAAFVVAYRALGLDLDLAGPAPKGRNNG